MVVNWCGEDLRLIGHLIGQVETCLGSLSGPSVSRVAVYSLYCRSTKIYPSWHIDGPLTLHFVPLKGSSLHSVPSTPAYTQTDRKMQCYPFEKRKASDFIGLKVNLL